MKKKHDNVGLKVLPVAMLWFIRVSVVVISLLAVFYIDRFNYRSFLEQTRADVASELAVLRAELEGAITKNLQTVRGMEAAIATEPGLSQERFDELADVILQDRLQLRNIGAAPDMVIRMTYPLAGNEAAIGLDFRANKDQWPEVKRSAESGQLVLAGPVNLVQGGQAFIGRIPVFTPARGGEPRKLWGMISAVIDRAQLYQEAGLLASDQLQTGMRKTLAGGEPGPVFHGEPALFDDNPVIMSVSVPGGTWDLAAVPAGGWPQVADNVLTERFLLALALLAIIVPVLMLTWSIQRQRIGQSQLRALFELSPLGIALADDETGRFIDVNQAMLALTGYDRVELLTRKVSDLTGGLEQTPLSHNAVGGLQEHTCLREDGSLFFGLLTWAPLQDESGRKLVWLVVQDISEQKRIEKMKSEFVSTVSHELRTPLSSISGSLKLVAGGAVGEMPEKMQSMVDIALKNSHRLAYLIDDLLDMDKLVAGKMRLSMMTLPVLPLVESSIRNQLGYANHYGVSIRLEGAVSDSRVRVDEQRFQQVMANLLSNALKFSPAGSEVVVTVETLGELLQVSVQDQGPGIPLSFHNRIFQRFAQADSSDTRAKGGTGLGLAITKKLMELMDGDVEFESESGQGSRFFISMPVAKSDDASTAQIV
ncbi:ATP-binding protein [Marinobacter caseinilyticus]|uniref:ATP-binding protein n=1 Tax=Marinobacter caseinilyticus TaxID=2692195 RepID=UPI001409E96D|nr:ATP-binding protein [Marinobacter caseinilyticus]